MPGLLQPIQTVITQGFPVWALLFGLLAYLFPGPLAGLGAVFSVWHNLSGALAAWWWRNHPPATTDAQAEP